MLIDSRFKNGFQILSLREDVGYKTDLAELEALIGECIAEGTYNFALRFTSKSYLSSRPLSILVSCVRNIRAHDGILALVEPSEAILDYLETFGLDTQIRVYSSEDAIGRS